jgi:hypothetical protein
METRKHKVQFILKGKLGPDIDALVKSFREVLVQPVDAEDQVITGEFAHSYTLEISNSKDRLGQQEALNTPHLLQSTTQNVFSVPAATNMASPVSAGAKGFTENRTEYCRYSCTNSGLRVRGATTWREFTGW